MRESLIGLGLALMAMSAAAQTNTFPASGNVGIGTTEPPSYLLTLAQPIATHQDDVEQIQNSATNANISFNFSGSSAVDVPSWGINSSIIEFSPGSNGNSSISSYTGNLLFQTNNRTTQMTITSGGAVG